MPLSGSDVAQLSLFAARTQPRQGKRQHGNEEGYEQTTHNGTMMDGFPIDDNPRGQQSLQRVHASLPYSRCSFSTAVAGTRNHQQWHVGN